MSDIETIVAGMTLEEKVGQMRQANAGDDPIAHLGDAERKHWDRIVECPGRDTAAEALKFLLQRRRRGSDDGAAGEESVAMARDVMSRTVMCVSEDQSLMEAANLMVNRDVAQLPVVREGELIGFLTRDTTLQRLQG